MVYLHNIDPVAVSLGPLSVHWYGIMYLLAFTAAWGLGRSRVRAGRLPGVDMNSFSDLIFYGMFGVVLGGRIGYMLFYATADFLANPFILLRVWEGGMSFHGGLIGVLVACGWWSYKQGIHFFDTLDFVAPIVPLGLGFGRMGNFIGGELWGKLTHSNWGVVFPHAPMQDTPAGMPSMTQLMSASQILQEHTAGTLVAYARHPSQLYQAVMEGFLLFAILWIVSRQPRPRYLISGLFALLYGIFRFGAEFVRMPDNGVYVAFGWLTRGQILSLPLIILGVVLLFMSKRTPVQRRWAKPSQRRWR